MPGGDDDERLPDGEDRVVGDLPQHVGDVAGGEKLAVRGNVDDDHDHDQRHKRPDGTHRVRAAPGGNCLIGLRRKDGFELRLRSLAAAPVATAMTLSGVASARENSAAIFPPRTTRTRCDIPSTSGSSLETMTIAAPRASSSSIRP